MFRVPIFIVCHLLQANVIGEEQMSVNVLQHEWFLNLWIKCVSSWCWKVSLHFLKNCIFCWNCVVYSYNFQDNVLKSLPLTHIILIMTWAWHPKLYVWTETRLSASVSSEKITVFRCDRKEKRGGVLIQTSLYVDVILLLCLRNWNRSLGTFVVEGTQASLFWVSTAPPLQLVKLWRKLGMYGELIELLSCLLWVTLTSAGFPATQTSSKNSVLN